jgi:hypothetical protein
MVPEAVRPVQQVHLRKHLQDEEVRLQMITLNLERKININVFREASTDTF